MLARKRDILGIVGRNRIAHDPRHSRRLINARRSQVRMVLSGTS
jgi:hypothetical protein